MTIRPLTLMLLYGALIALTPTKRTRAMRPLARFAAAGGFMARGEYVDGKPRRFVELAAARTVRVEASFALPACNHCGTGFGHERGGHDSSFGT